MNHPHKYARIKHDPRGDGYYCIRCGKAKVEAYPKFRLEIKLTKINKEKDATLLDSYFELFDSDDEATKQFEHLIFDLKMKIK